MGKLTARKAETAKKPGCYHDGDGLMLVIGKRGGKSWVLRTVVQGKRRDIGLGGYSYTSLAEAREKARELRKVAREGGNPLASRKKTLLSFEDSARRVHTEQVVPTSKNPKHRDQWINSLRDYAFPVIGSMPIERIESVNVLHVLQPIWLEKAETARRVRQRMSTIFDWARTAGHREAGNPVDGIETALAKQPKKDKHHAAMPHQQIPAFFENLRAQKGVASQALALLILTATRTSEVLLAQWQEVEGDVWTIPPARMKTGKEHRVPLNPSAVAILEQLKGLDDYLIFPGQRRGKPLSNMSMAAVLKRAGLGHFTVHGFRSAFRDWAGERTSTPRDIAELCLAHQVGNAVERAYARSDLFEKRRYLMERWATFCCSGAGTVVELAHG